MFKEIFSNQTIDAVSSQFPSPKDRTIDVRLSGQIGAGSLWLILIGSNSYGESEVNLEITDSQQAFPLTLNEYEEFRFELRDTDTNTNLTAYFSY